MYQNPEQDKAQTPEVYIGRAHEVHEAVMTLESVIAAGLEDPAVTDPTDFDHVAQIDALPKQVNRDRGYDNV